MKANCLYTSVPVESEAVGDHRRKERVSFVVSTTGSAVAEGKIMSPSCFQVQSQSLRNYLSTLPLDSTMLEAKGKVFPSFPLSYKFVFAANQFY